MPDLIQHSVVSNTIVIVDAEQPYRFTRGEAHVVQQYNQKQRNAHRLCSLYTCTKCHRGPLKR